MIELPDLPEVELRIPEDEKRIRALGYAIGMSDGMFSSHGQPPPVSHVYLKGPPPTTNDPEAFQQVSQEGYELGFFFGRQAAQELRPVLLTTPEACRWPICFLFAEQRLLGSDHIPEEVLAGFDTPIQEGLKTFQRIYQRHLL